MLSWQGLNFFRPKTFDFYYSMFYYQIKNFYFKYVNWFCNDADTFSSLVFANYYQKLQQGVIF